MTEGPVPSGHERVRLAPYPERAKRVCIPSVNGSRTGPDPEGVLVSEARLYHLSVMLAVFAACHG